MKGGSSFIELRICLSQPPELLDLVAIFAAIANQFDLYVKKNHPDLDGHARLYVKEIREGSIIVELIPYIGMLIQGMDTALIVDGFVTRYAQLLSKFKIGEKLEDASKAEIKNFLGMVRAVAHDADGKAVISSAEYHGTKTTKRISVQFNSEDAKKARDTLERQVVELDLPAHERCERVLMRYYQPNIGDPAVGSKRTGEKVIIPLISPKHLAIIYETELAKERILHEKAR